MSITSGTDVCIRNASSYWAIRVSVSGCPSSSACIAFRSCRASRLVRRIERSIPAGSETYSTGSPFDRHCTPWYTDGRNPLPHAPWPALGCTPLEISTTNPGRSWFSDPSPYVTHEPSDGRPVRGEPVNSSNSAGAWLNWSVYIDLITQSSSATSCRCGMASDIQMPRLAPPGERPGRAQQLRRAGGEGEPLAP